jgi:hypothetical protein
MQRARQGDPHLNWGTVSECRELHFKEMIGISKHLDDIVSGHCSSAHYSVLNKSPIDLTLDPPELTALIDDQFSSLRNLIKILLANDRDSAEKLKKAEAEIDTWNSEISRVLKISDDLLPTTVNILSHIKNSLHDKLIEFGSELDRRDKALKTIWTRVSAISKAKAALEETFLENPSIFGNSYYPLKKSNILTLILNGLGDIQDTNERLENSVLLLTQEKANLSESLESIEIRLRKANCCGFATDEVSGAEAIHKLIDSLVTRQFSDDFMSLEEINKLFKIVKSLDLTTHPKEYIPVLCQKYNEMEKAASMISDIVKILESIFIGLGGGNGRIEGNKFLLLQTLVNDLHAELELWSGVVTVTPVFVVVSRFVALVQTLVAQISVAQIRVRVEDRK